MSDVVNNEQPQKKKFSLDPMTSPGAFGAFGGLFIIQGIISLVWGITKHRFNINPEQWNELTAVSTQDIARMAICIYGLICIIGGIFMLGIDQIIEILKPTGRKPTLKGWFFSIAAVSFVSGIVILLFFIIFSLIQQ